MIHCEICISKKKVLNPHFCEVNLQLWFQNKDYLTLTLFFSCMTQRLLQQHHNFQFDLSRCLYMYLKYTYWNIFFSLNKYLHSPSPCGYLHIRGNLFCLLHKAYICKTLHMFVMLTRTEGEAAHTHHSRLLQDKILVILIHVE